MKPHIQFGSVATEDWESCEILKNKKNSDILAIEKTLSVNTFCNCIQKYTIQVHYLGWTEETVLGSDESQLRIPFRNNWTLAKEETGSVILWSCISVRDRMSFVLICHTINPT